MQRLSSEEVNAATRVQILNEADCILLFTKTPEKVVNLYLLLPIMRKL